MDLTYRVERRHPRLGWQLIRPDASGLTDRAANQIAESEREFERRYAAISGRAARIRVANEQTGQGLWLA